MSPLPIDQMKNELVDHTPFPSFVMNLHGDLLEWNNWSEVYFGYKADDFAQNSLRNSLFASVHEEAWDVILTSEQAIRFNNLQLVMSNGNLIDVSLFTKHCLFNDEQALFVMSIPLDAVHTMGDNYQELIDLRNGIQSSFMTVTLDHEGFIVNGNQHFLKTSHWTPKRVVGKTFWRLFPETPDSEKIAQTIWKTLNNGHIWQGEVEKATKNGESYWVYLTAIPTIGTKSEDTRFILIEKDITKEKTIQLQLEKIAFIDAQTGLMNVHRLESVITEMIAEGRHFSFVYVSIDKFYTIKDLHDQEVENGLIVEFTKRMKMYFQDSTMARINEHEFVVITPLPEWFIQGFLNYLQQHPIYNHNIAIPLAISGGISRYPEDQSTFLQLMKASLATIATVREAGGNNIASLSRATHKTLNRQAVIEKRLLLALNQQNLQVLYQPQMDLQTGKITTVEALVRWTDEEIGVVSPDELIPVAEETGLINRIGAFMLEKACEQAVAWHHAGINVKVSINSSVREFRDKNMAKSILETLEKANCPAHLIQIEITEKFALEAEGETSIINQMRQLEEKGIVFVLDDFGTGYASFRYMQLLPIEVLKIDQTFISSLTKSEKTQRLIDGMIQLGKSMNLTVLAEGVETEEQKNLLENYGCDSIQGYYISKPVEWEEIERLYKAR
ncbi:sensor domain-containing protein [Lysinibacillus sp. LZ02]|uniref:sensor domain-containing protein n=1 Tax=Lysinibacillus sp. LZ02 TaxID=3420668 RepID=UPI003D36E9BA